MANKCCNSTKGCDGNILSTNCVIWGDDKIEDYDINRGDTVTNITGKILNAIDEVKTGTSITLQDLKLPSCYSNIGKSLTNVLNVLLKNQCEIKDKVGTSTDISSYDMKCVDVAGTGEFGIIQGMINKICSNTSSITSTNTQVNKNKTDIQNLKSANNASFTFSQLTPPWVLLPYFGSLSNFDSSGKGLPEKGFDKVYIANGKNGTPDWRGRTPIGATLNIPGGGSLDSTVNNMSISVGQKYGEYEHNITSGEMPKHYHTGNTEQDSGHQHDFDDAYYMESSSSTIGKSIYGSYEYVGPTVYGGSSKTDNDNNYLWTRPNKTKKSSGQHTHSFKTNEAGGSNKMKMLQPGIGVVWIIKIP